MNLTIDKGEVFLQKIKILAVAPYEGMADLITEIGEKREDIELTVQIGDLNIGRKIAIDLAHKNYDVIISRGGTAEMIRSTVDLPVIDISISGYDILRTIKLAENYSGKFIIAGFPGITDSARVLCDLLQYDIDIITFTSEEDAVPALRSAKKKGCTLVLCDMTGSNAAKKLNLNSILIPSGAESIETAFNAAAKMVHSSLHVHKQKDLFQALLTSEDRQFLIYDPAGSLWFSSFAMEEVHLSLMNFVQTYLAAFLKVPNQCVERQIRDKIYTLTNRHLYYSGQKYTAITIKQKNALFQEEDAGITIYNQSDHPSDDFFDFYSSSNNIGNISYIVEEYSKSKLPVLITGEAGTGKDKIASFLYENGPFGDSPYYIIDCEQMNERKWNTVVSSDNSPLNTTHSTIYIKNPGALSENQCEKLFTYLDHTNLSRRNRLLFSLILNTDQYPCTQKARDYLENRLSCLTLYLPPLRERKEDLKSIIALYLHRLNVSLGKQIIGLEAEAMERMTAFPWPRNMAQLQHVLKELAVLTKTPYITAQDTSQMLNQESPTSLFAPHVDLDLNQTLEDINYQIIQRILEEEHGNKEKTSRRLGISRSTLWRILKNRQAEE